MNIAKKELFLACIPCLPINENVRLTPAKVVQIPIKKLSFLNLSIFNESWIYRFFMQEYKVYVYAKKQFDTPIKDIEVGRHSVKECIPEQIKQNLNCTKAPESCKHILDAYLDYTELPQHVGKMEYVVTFYPYGVQIHGFRYSIFVQKSELHSNANVLALLSPFNTVDWSVIFVTFCSVLLALKMVSKRKRWTFWLISALLEQNDDNRTYLSVYTWQLIFSWSIATILIRNLYTASMYTYMTKEPKTHQLS